MIPVQAQTRHLLLSLNLLSLPATSPLGHRFKECPRAGDMAPLVEFLPAVQAALGSVSSSTNRLRSRSWRSVGDRIISRSSCIHNRFESSQRYRVTGKRMGEGEEGQFYPSKCLVT